MSKVVPEGWQLFLFDQVFLDIRNGCSIDQNNLEQGVPVTRIETIAQGEIDYTKTGWIKTKEDIERFIIEEGDILFSHINSLQHIGKTAIKKDNRVLYHGMNLLRLRVDKTRFSPCYIYNFLNWDKVRDELRRKAKQAVNQASLNVQDIKTCEHLIPSLSEQQKIATILSSVDNVIEKTRSQIDKLKDLKTGMMQELLTKGIGHTEFKDSPVGWIPTGWSVQKIDSLVTKVGSGVTPRGGSEAYVSSGIPLIRSQNVYSDGLRIEDIAYITVEQHQKMANSQLKPHDVLLNITGASIGRCYYLPSDFKEGNVNQHVCIIRPKQSVISSVFLAYLLNSELGQRQIMSLQAGGNREGLNFQQVREIGFAIPTLLEQQKIVNLLQSIDTKIMTVSQKFISVEQTKKALMQDLLTGKVRVKLGC